MVKYIYEKYNSNYSSGTTTTYTENSFGAWSAYESKDSNAAFYGHSSYGFSSSSGLYTVGSEQTYYTNATYYRGSSTSITEYQIFDSSGGTAQYRYRTKTATKSTSSYGNYSKGSYIGQVIAENGTYPSNGRHSPDGYWYVRRFEATPPTVTSPNGGESWDATETITWTNSQTELRYKIELTVDNGESWTTLNASTSTDATSFVYDFSNEPQSSLAKIRVTGVYDGLYTLSDSSDGVFTIQHNQAPTIPTNLSPSGGTLDRTKVIRFSWQHNDANANDNQSMAEFYWRLQTAPTWNEIVINGTAQYLDMNSNTLPAGVIQWDVRTYDQSGVASPYAGNRVFTAAEPTNAPTITQPGATVSVARPVIGWTAATQTAYHITITDSLNAVVWDTGEVVSTVRAVTAGVDLLNGGTYTLAVKVKGSGGIFSTTATHNFSVSYTPPPTPTHTVEGKGHYLDIFITNPTPTGTEPALLGNDLYRRGAGEMTWKRIASGLGETYQDHTAASERKYEYKVIANGQNATNSESEIVNASIKFAGVFIHSVRDAEATSHHYKFDGSGRDSTKQAEHAFRQFAGRKKQVVEYGEAIGYAVSASVQVLKEDDGAEKLERFVVNMETICYRDGRGRLLFGVITAAPLKDVVYGWETTINVTEIDYNEVV